MDDFVSLIVVVLCLAAIGVCSYNLGVNSGQIGTMDEAQLRGYTEYCQNDGSRVWIGECDQ